MPFVQAKLSFGRPPPTPSPAAPPVATPSAPPPAVVTAAPPAAAPPPTAPPPAPLAPALPPPPAPVSLPSPPATVPSSTSDPTSVGNVSAVPAPESLAPGGLSAYERERLANIERNEQVLRSLGLLNASSSLAAPRTAAAKRPRPRERPPPPPPSTRSLRTRSNSGAAVTTTAGGGGAAGGGSAESDGVAEEEEEEEEELVEEDSAVYRYLCSCAPPHSHRSAAAESATDGPSATGEADEVAAEAPSPALRGWRPTGWSAKFNAKGIYALDGCAEKQLVALGGADGWVDIHATGGAAEGAAEPGAGQCAQSSAPLCGFKAHGGWVGDLQFVASGGAASSSATLLLSCANDHTLRLHDLNRRVSGGSGKAGGGKAGGGKAGGGKAGGGKAGSPVELAQLERHQGGIYSLHESDQNVVRATHRLLPRAVIRLEHTCAVTLLAPHTTVHQPRFSHTARDHALVTLLLCHTWPCASHASPVPPPPPLSAIAQVSCGKDGFACLTALGAASLQPVASWETQIRLQRCVRWRDAHVFACAGDNELLAFDTRQARSPVLRMADLHTGASAAESIVSCLCWSPTQPSLLATAGHDRTIRLFDVRLAGGASASASAAARHAWGASAGHVLRGHMRDKISSKYSIYAPCFTHGGRGLTTLGHGSNAVSVYGVEDGTRVSEVS